MCPRTLKRKVQECHDNLSNILTQFHGFPIQISQQYRRECDHLNKQHTAVILERGGS